MAYQVELGRVHESRAGRFVTGLFGKGKDFVEGGGVETIKSGVSDFQDIVGHFTDGRRVELVDSTSTTTITPRTSPPTFQTRTSLARQEKTEELLKRAKLPLILGAGALVAILLLRK